MFVIDCIGNPTFDGTWMYTWQAGRQLAAMQKTGMTVEYAYDHNGLRTQKVVTTGGITTTANYQLHGKLVTELIRGTDKLHFFYDVQSRPVMVEYNGVMYTYVHNLQGDIDGILDSTGAVVVEYSYDAWGRPTGVTGSMAATLGESNPFRYRGYVYDDETGLYYLRSRYYNPVNGRFVGIDYKLFHCPLGMNLFSYCHSEPICFFDSDGATPIEYYSIAPGKTVDEVFDQNTNKPFPVPSERAEKIRQTNRRKGNQYLSSSVQLLASVKLPSFSALVLLQ